MSKYKVVIADYYYPSLEEEMKVFERLGPDAEILDCTKLKPGGIKDPRELAPYAADADALIVQFAVVDRELIESMTKCKVIARYAIGVDTIDLKAAAEKGIFVSNVPDYCIDEVADTAAAHILGCARKVTHARDMLLEDKFSMDAIRPMKRLKNCTLCLMGFGNIARNLYEKMSPFFKSVVVVDPYFTRQDEYPKAEFMTLEQALPRADVVSVHVPLSDATRGMLSEKEFGLMKDGVIIVNTARGGIIDENALKAALDSGKVGFCGLDVISTEDFAQSELLRNPRVVLTPHVSWCSEDAMLELQRKTAENVVETLLNGRPKYCVK